MLPASFIPTLAAQPHTNPVALDLLFILAMAVVVATLFRRFKLDSIPGFLIAGAIAGPHALGLVRTSESVDSINQLATILLMFGIGLHLDMGSIKRGMVHILGIGLVSTLGFILAAWLMLSIARMHPAPALLLAMALSMTSTAVFVRILSSRREFRTQHGRVGLGVSIVQDLLAVLFLALIPLLAKWAGVGQDAAAESATADGVSRWVHLLSTAGQKIGGAIVLILFGKYVLPRILKEVTRVGSSELLLVLAGAIALGAAIGTTWLGFSPEMGAFLAGFLLAATPYRYQLAGQLAPVRDLFMAIFFTAVGMQVVPSEVLANWWIIALGVAGVMVLKGAITAATGWAFGMTAPSAVLTAAYLGNSGEFTLVVLNAGVDAGLFGERVKAVTIAIVIISLVIAPSLAEPSHRWAAAVKGLRLARWVRTTALREPVPASHHEHHHDNHDHAHREGHRHAHDAHPPNPDTPDASPQSPEPAPTPRKRVIIAGFGPVGRALADRFDVMHLPYTVVELNPRTVERQTSVGRHIVFGDVTNLEVLESAGIREAEAVVLTIPDEDAVLRACQVIRETAPDVFIAARTNFLSQAFRAQQLGADHVTVEEVATAQAMEREVLAKLHNLHKPTPRATV